MQGDERSQAQCGADDRGAARGKHSDHRVERRVRLRAAPKASATSATSALAPGARPPGVRQPQLPRSTASSNGFLWHWPPSQMLSPVQSASLSQPVPH
jgi:hypothetical protein